jgi:Zn-dependent protease with chaperone function
MDGDLEPLRFSHEGQLLREIAARLGPAPLRSLAEGEAVLSARRRELLGDAVRVTAELLPEVHGAYQECLRRAGGDLTGDLFIQQSPVYNASVFAHEGRFDLLVHSSLINDFSLDGLRFVIGHELGHVVFCHSDLPVHEILTDVHGIPPEVANLLLRWSRAAEVSADRVGLLCCGQLTTAVTALFQTASGLKDIDEDRVLGSFRSQYAELEAHIRGEKHRRTWMRSHPMIPVRFKALELAALDIVSLRKDGPAGFSWKSFRAVDGQIAFILEGLEA